MSFTQAELDAIAAADAEIEADFCLTPDEIAAARDRDERAIFERVCGKRARAAPKSLEEKERDFQKFKARRKKPLTDKDRERAKAYYHAHKEYTRPTAWRIIKPTANDFWRIRGNTFRRIKRNVKRRAPSAEWSAIILTRSMRSECVNKAGEKTRIITWRTEMRG